LEILAMSRDKEFDLLFVHLEKALRQASALECEDLHGLLSMAVVEATNCFQRDNFGATGGRCSRASSNG
jgi:hypothetical protein